MVASREQNRWEREFFVISLLTLELRASMCLIKNRNDLYSVQTTVWQFKL